jgi:hypothetical protein
MDRKRTGKLGAAGKVAAEARRAGELAAAYNLAGLRPREVQLCLSLVGRGGAVTRAEWLASAGLDPRNGRARTDGGRRCYVCELERRGLVTRLKRASPATGGRRPDLFLPTALLLDLLAAAASRPSLRPS